MSPLPRRPRRLRHVAYRPAVKPAWLDVHPGAVAVWDELASGRIALGLLSDVTAEGFAHLCVYVAANRRKPLDASQRDDMRHLMRAFGFPLARGRRWARTHPTARRNRQHRPHTDRHTP